MVTWGQAVQRFRNNPVHVPMTPVSQGVCVLKRKSVQTRSRGVRIFDTSRVKRFRNRWDNGDIGEHSEIASVICHHYICVSPVSLVTSGDLSKAACV